MAGFDTHDFVVGVRSTQIRVRMAQAVKVKVGIDTGWISLPIYIGQVQISLASLDLVNRKCSSPSGFL